MASILPKWAQAGGSEEIMKRLVDPEAREAIKTSVFFDPASISSNATAKNPRRYASGIALVLVNGKLSMFNGQQTSVNGGRVIREFATA